MRRCSSTTSGFFRVSFDIAVILLAVLALSPLKARVVVDTDFADGRIHADRDIPDSVALVKPTDEPQFSGEAVYLLPEAAFRPHISLTASSHSYRGPPIIV